MAQTTNYISTLQVLSDTTSLIRILSGQQLSLASIQSLAQTRWPWIFDNWVSLYPRFKASAAGAQDLESKLDSFQRFIDSWRLGNRNNPLDVLGNFAEVYPFLDLISLSELRLSPDEAALRDIEIDRIQSLDIENFRSMMSFLRARAAVLAQQIGLGDPSAAKLLGTPQTPRQRSPTIDDLQNIQDINKLHSFVESLLFRALRSQKRPPNVLSLSNQLIDPGSPVIFDDKFVSYTPQPFEISIEHMAQRYIGDRAYWYELATINNLQPPYVDEVGTKYPLLAPGAVNNLIIADTDRQKIPVGTKVGIGSYKYREETRVVERLILNENGTVIVFLSGAQNINRLKPAEGAFVRIYAPSTIRKGAFMLIPSRTPSRISTSVPVPTSDELRRIDKALLQFGVDIARDDKTADIIIDPSGNFKYAAGLPNVRQAVLNALKTTQGELIFHPGYGVNLNIGGRFFGTTDEALLFGELLRSTLLTDSRLENVQIAKVEATGTGIALTLLITIAGATQALPLSFIS